ncbi:MAG: selenocysteine-specific translation elongation factor [Nitrospira sp.]|nr:selenocysteine-specific translation elongation factor [Nitrospira sp.]
MQYVILGTAGHIDHGKSALVKALTGIDPDRLKEEKDRGMTIDLGFADLLYPNGLTVGIVDVPGHERLIRNMLAGAGGIDIVLFVIAADESIMPQSREHLHICNLLKIKSGLIALTKVDLVEKDWLDLVEDDIRLFVKGTFLEKAAIVPVSSKTLFKIDLLKEKIRETALKVEPKSAKGLYRLPIDRVFTLKGFGTIITGTAFSGSISVGDVVEILPSGIKSKVRGLHSHGKSIKTAYAGQRVAMNLQGVDKDELKRGDCVVMPERFSPTKMIDAKLELLLNVPPLKSRDLIHLHVGTSEVMARVVLYGRNEIKAGENCYCQFRLQEHIIAMSGDRYIIRRFSPVETIGGGEVCDPSSHKMSHKKSIEDLKIFETGILTEKISVKVKRSGIQGINASLIAGWVSADFESIKEAIESLKKEGTVKQFESILIHKTTFDSFREIVKKLLQDFHERNPLKPGIQKEELRSHSHLKPKLFDQMISAHEGVIVDRDIVRLLTFNITLSKEDETLRATMFEILGNAGFQPLTVEELSQSLRADQKYLSEILKLMVKEGSLMRINDSFYITSSVYKRMIELLKDFSSRKTEMLVSEFREILGTSRKYALPFLEYLDSNKITRRTDEKRFLSSRIICNI